MEEEKWGRRIRAFRKLKGFTQEGLARELGISVSILGEIERGNRKPKEELITKIATIFQVSIDELTQDYVRR
ncbi:helix-turn-helix transcriptional regulator [Fictibacillus enclensis]|uniref:helix-turn-helix domain-containing protein n=1 Tax=Fictibacillus enclensis TaxID=1017270 RepID=UPI0024C0BE7F|nr:helix-turn-helix transcriptional regulator [Fictibacillus enclensis]MDM5196860.1 helix-turn-helix transcriptional regulator [Fictibacillus enclensis]MDM5335988.1 helix-turn-helix transcriptional regulator [Fictibacillus enclensis]WHY72481.1 helix-turn-helix transcriptional regulator [Fictibacillus enclensis]